jgi:hypothetical protein
MKFKITNYLGIVLGVAYDKYEKAIVILLPFLSIAIRKK